jgi:hypothetical protein
MVQNQKSKRENKKQTSSNNENISEKPKDSQKKRKLDTNNHNFYHEIIDNNVSTSITESCSDSVLVDNNLSYRIGGKLNTILIKYLNQLLRSSYKIGYIVKLNKINHM